MSRVVFSTLQYAKSLQSVGFTEAQAETIAEGAGTTHHAMQDFVTKKELYEVRDELNQKIDEKFSHLDEKFCFSNKRVLQLEKIRANDIGDLYASKLFNRLGSLIVACTAIGFIILAFMIKGI
jgi:hypothetical protein